MRLMHGFKGSTTWLMALLVIVAGCKGKVGQYDTVPPTDLAGSDTAPGDGPRSDGPRSDGPRSDGPRSDGPRRDGPGSDGPVGGDLKLKKDVKVNDSKGGCVNECPTKGFKGCRTGGVVTCGQYDADTCLEWGKASPCAKTMGPATCGTNTISRQITPCLGGQCVKLELQGPCPFGCSKGQCAAPPAGTGGKMVTLWRWFNAKVPNHFTSNDIKETPTTAIFQGQSFYVPAASASGRKPLYRLLRKSNGDHMISTSKTEAASAGYAYEATLGYPFSKAFTGTAQLYRWNNAKTADHLLAFAHENPATMGYSKEGLMGHGYARPGTSVVKLSTVSAAGITLRANPAVGGAVWSLSYNGKQLINQYDNGRLLQAQLNLSAKIGADTPTEAGSRWSSPATSAGRKQGSPQIASSTAGPLLSTSCRPLQWDPGQHGGGKGHPVVWDGFIDKELELNYKSLGPVIRWTVVARLPKSASSMEAAVVSAALNKEYSRFWAYDASTGKLAEVTSTVPSGGCLSHTKDPRLQPKAGGVIISSANQNHALGIFRARGQRRFRLCRSAGGTTGPNGSGYSRFSLLEQQPKGAPTGTQIWTAYLVVGTVKACRASMDKLHNAAL